MGAVAERHIGDSGTPESHWASLLARVPMWRLDNLIGAAARLVVVAPHPDDEVLACGGLIAEHAARGGQVRVIAVTDGEASHPDSDTWTARALAGQRRLESEQGLRSLGVEGSCVTRLGYPDGGLARYLGPLRETLSLSLRANDVVVSTWKLDGHPDHDAVGAATEAACAEVGATCLHAPVWMWHWSRIGDPLVPWDRLRGLQLSPSALERKRLALSAHATQLAPRTEHQGPVLDPLIVARAVRPAEYFFVQT